MTSRDALTKAVTSTGQKLVRGDHFASREINNRLQQLEATVRTLKEESELRKKRLVQAYEAQQFLTELLEAELWMSERRYILDTPDCGKNEESTQALLRKLEATSLDLEGFMPRVVKLRDTGANLADSKNPESVNVIPKLQAVLDEYQSLLDKSQNLRMQLREQCQWFQFKREVELVEAWLTSKQTVAESDDYGQDLEDVEVQEKKFQDFMKEIESLGQSKMVGIHESASSLAKESHSKLSEIQTKTNTLNVVWERLCQTINHRAENLEAAHNVHQFDHDVDELRSWMQEKEAVADTDDYGYDLPGVQTLLSQHEGLERDLAAIKKEVERIHREAQRVSHEYPQVKENVAERLMEVKECWENLYRKCQERKERLSQAEQVQLYFNQCRELMVWAKEMHAMVMSEELANDIGGAELLIKRHDEYKREIDKQWLNHEEVQQAGNTLVKNGHFMSEEIEEKLLEQSELMRKVAECWEVRKELYEENLEIQLLRHELEQAEGWLNAKEGFLLDADYGDSVSKVEVLLKKHGDFEKMLTAQQEKFAQLERKTKKEKKLLKQIDADEKGQKDNANIIKVPSLKRKTSDRKTAPSKIQDWSALKKFTPPTLSLKGPHDTVASPVLNSADRSQPFSLWSDLRISSSEEPSTGPVSPLVKSPAVPKLMGLQATSFENRSPLSPPFTSRLMTQQSFSSMADPYSKLSPEKNLNGSHMSNMKETSSKTALDLDHNILDITRKAPRLSSSSSSEQAVNKVSVSTDHPLLTGYLEAQRRQLSGGKEASSASWEDYYVTLSRQSLCCYKTRKDADQKVTDVPPINTAGARCERALAYTAKENTFSLRLDDGSEYLFSAPSAKKMDIWIQALQNNLDLGENSSFKGMDLPVAVNSVRPPSMTPQARSVSFPTPETSRLPSATGSTKRQAKKDLLPRRTPSFQLQTEVESVKIPREAKEITKTVTAHQESLGAESRTTELVVEKKKDWDTILTKLQTQNDGGREKRKNVNVLRKLFHKK